MFTNHQLGFVGFTRGQFHRNAHIIYLWYEFENDYFKITQLTNIYHKNFTNGVSDIIKLLNPSGAETRIFCQI